MAKSPFKKTKSQQQLRTYQPTYRLESQKPFNVERVEYLIKRYLDSELETVEYDEKLIPELAMHVADELKTIIKEENYDRYRILVICTIGQKRQQSVHVAHTFLWDADRDTFAFYHYENCYIFAQVTVYAVYLD